MDDEHVEHEFFNIAMNDYTASLEKFIEYTRVQHLRTRKALLEGDVEAAGEIAAETFGAVNTVQVGNIHNLVSGYAMALNHERAAGMEMLRIVEAVQEKLKQFHAHLVHIGQPNEELLMITDLMASVQKHLDESTYGQTANGNGEMK